jgi:hypothetical protein
VTPAERPIAWADPGELPDVEDLGEITVIAHAVVAAESGQPVTVLIDDGPGAASLR